MDNKKTTSRLIVQYFLDQIQKGNIKKGDKLMTEHELSDLLGVSRVPLREALCVLNTIGILDCQQGSGRTVSTKCDANILGHMLYTYAVLDDVSLQQIMAVRLLLEPDSARQVAINGSESLKNRIAELSEKYCAIANVYSGTEAEYKEILLVDYELHKCIIEACKNPFLSMLFEIVTYSFEEFQQCRQSNDGTSSSQHWQSLSNEHRDIACAILNGDGDAAYHAMEHHLHLIKQDIDLNSIQQS